MERELAVIEEVIRRKIEDATLEIADIFGVQPNGIEENIEEVVEDLIHTYKVMIKENQNEI